ncbi:ABC transporter ATP-binding protein [Actinomyces procaprae]|uniref:ABC transporter ATP-binding protein n=1 Tax=Actinomyces procaprae TaxID=2560010 RepID=UPI0010A265C2|nr:ABC transporter ATP-binding protein [Actinomyces procaprae]
MNTVTPTRPGPTGGDAAVRFPDAVVTTRALTKTFGRGAAARTAVDHLDLVIPRGVVYGFLGPNGSGKSTTMKLLLGLLTPTSGSVNLFGVPLDRRSRGGLMARTGSMIEQPPGYGHLTGAENMRLVQRMLGLSDAQVDRALDLVRLTGHRDRLVKTYSMGMKQRLGIAMALARQPELLILDEPTNGLDPAGIEEIRRLLVSLAGQGVTVMVSSHLLDEIDRMAGVLGILSAGRLVFQGTRAELMRRSVPDLLVVTPRPEALTPALLAGLAGARRDAGARASRALAPAGAETGAGVRISGLPPDGAAELVRRLVAADVPVHELRREARSLEDVFMDLTGGAGAL